MDLLNHSTIVRDFFRSYSIKFFVFRLTRLCKSVYCLSARYNDEI
ncbi:hypothetical protein LEP1GSC016_0225 [Leptospira borgpetersenii serovar Hardjo-bovis str. Sponselee]|uniref:Uncharacterized protein n=6 Tax=Leptospira borgpetersenii TaxID=174 RepID=A0A0S2IRA7_LEPBO|nr:hypothetical protein LBBP_01916 [Leptospira borgpetersenii serovar Ballum]EKP13049.1 hypothetical protein LEP1GSC128_3041 [Leptospira borgpetersenii str. 200801926]EKQ92118.1 hypothetical protein LEP1GSC101_3378 [Leptospira borgpetersenii str. UI 09149]EKR01818.1 hypothetical protein LEP1GSC121_3977 [Leptospira borgpetersenii serovar Castellonis str. 200801910]EMJ83607.1 hypothetical protein LEP1GSC016_0225 [Leptospira borgpetersenii serovar Hardjo-bovis str. Sponselee]EMN12657.1 hypothetic